MKATAVIAPFLVLLFGIDTVFAQSLVPTPGSSANPVGDLNVTGGGWQQVYNLRELQAFAIDVMVTLALAALISFHPVRMAARTAPADHVMPRLFLLYALIGMAIGFLVIQHGYIIGFVVFGIGALLRFRSRLDDPIDTVEMILVTVLGLCVGLDLPVMAVLIGIVSWCLIWFSGQTTPIEVRLQADDANTLEAGISSIRDVSGKCGWREVHFHRSRSKHSARMVILVKTKQGLEDTEEALNDGLPPDGLTWKLGG